MSYQENFAEVLDTVCGQRRMQENAWPEEQEDFAHDIMALLAKAFVEGYRTSPGFGDDPYDNPYKKEYGTDD